MADLLLAGIGELVTNAPGAGDLVGTVRDAAVVVGNGRVTWAGPAADVPDHARALPTIDCEGRAAVPGFVDAHTHLVFAGDRAGEFGRRLRGETYEEILAAGGGIHSTVQATRAAGTEQLLAAATRRAREMLAGGTTTVEVKSGYGLNVTDERRMLEVAAAVGEREALDVVPTFLGAHVVDRGVDREEYVRLVVREMLPACAPLARFCDVFCDEGAFTVNEARSILVAAAAYGLGAKLHAEQLGATGAARLAAELGAVSADHLDHTTAADAAALATAGTIGVLLPGVMVSLGTAPPPVETLRAAGLRLAVATDCNPGTSFIQSMPLMVALACLEMGLTPEEAVWGATRGGALALDLEDRGGVVPGWRADLVVLDAPSYLHLPYRPGAPLVWKVIKDGAVVVG